MDFFLTMVSVALVSCIADSFLRHPSCTLHDGNKGTLLHSWHNGLERVALPVNVKFLVGVPLPCFDVTALLFDVIGHVG